MGAAARRARGSEQSGPFVFDPSPERRYRQGWKDPEAVAWGDGENAYYDGYPPVSPYPVNTPEFVAFQAAYWGSAAADWLREPETAPYAHLARLTPQQLDELIDWQWRKLGFGLDPERERVERMAGFFREASACAHKCEREIH